MQCDANSFRSRTRCVQRATSPLLCASRHEKKVDKSREVLALPVSPRLPSIKLTFGHFRSWRISLLLLLRLFEPRTLHLTPLNTAAFSLPSNMDGSVGLHHKVHALGSVTLCLVE